MAQGKNHSEQEHTESLFTACHWLFCKAHTDRVLIVFYSVYWIACGNAVIKGLPTVGSIEQYYYY